ncbi:MAG TPA: hypothetical protein PLI53_00750 [Geobacteraceae bacterium]|nr:hypothetical protein [Geobacteraceae bacterium]
MNQSDTVIPIAIRKLKRVAVRLPPARLFDEPLGCYGDNRFFALWWSRTDQAPVLNDSVLEYAGIAAPYRAWRYHPQVIAALARYNIGDAAITADHWLLVDRRSRALYVGKVWDVVDVLDYQKSGEASPPGDAGAESGSGVSIETRKDNNVQPSQANEMPPVFNKKLLDELKAWLDANLSDRQEIVSLSSRLCSHTLSIVPLISPCHITPALRALDCLQHAIV